MLAAGHRRQKRDLVAIGHGGVHARVLCVARARHGCARTAPSPETRAASCCPHAGQRRAARHVALQFAARRRSPAAAQTGARSRACAPPRFRRARLVVRVGRGAFDPHVAALEVLVLPDRRDLLHPLDRVAARRECVGAVRRRRDDGDAGLADLQPAEAVVNAELAAGQRVRDLLVDPRERLQRERLVRLVFEERARARPRFSPRTRPRKLATAPTGARMCASTRSVERVERRARPRSRANRAAGIDREYSAGLRAGASDGSRSRQALSSMLLQK